MRATCILIAIAVFLLSSAAHAVTYIVPADREIIQQSDDIVVATGVSSLVERTARGGIVTRATLRIDEVLKGERSAGDALVLTERGGILDGAIQYIPGTPEYKAGERYLVFTETNRHGEPVTFGMGLGQFFFTSQQGRALALRADIEGFNQNLDRHVERARDAAGFLEYIRGIVAQSIDPEPRYFVPNANARWEPAGQWTIASEATRGSYLLRDSEQNQPFRWFTPSTSFVKSGTPAGPDGNAAVALSFTQWNGTDSNIHYTDGGQDNTATGGFEDPDGKDTILFNDPNGEVNGGVAGIGGITNGGNSYTLDGETFWRMLEVDVVMNDGSFAQNCFNTVMVHEVGHTLGFRHSNQPPSPGDISTTNAIMNSAVSCSWNGILKQYDEDAAATVYGSGPVCVPPAISAHPVNKTITPPATSVSLGVGATGTAPLSYQWFIGNSGDTSQPTGTNNSSITVSPTVTTNYWVRVTGQCAPAADSNAATVTVLPCQPPQISSQSNDRTITAGTSTQLTVNATGTATLHYQWYIGQPGNTSQPTGPDNKNLTVSPSNSTTYWVRVTGPCGPAADSGAIVVTVQACPAVVVGTPTKLPSGGSVILDVTAASTGGGSLSYVWFLGNTPGSGGTQVGNTKSITVAVTSEVKNYWVRVTNSCNNSAFSELVAVASCSLPGIETQPADQSITTGSSATVSLVLVGDGTGVTVTWYSGVAPDKTNQIGTGTSVNVGPLTATTSYWAAVRNSCGEVSTRTAVITVTACAAPTVTTPPTAQQITANTTATLEVVAAGTPTLLYQWYEGLESDTTKPIDGATLPTFVTPKLLKSTSFWVRISNACGSTDSEAALITVPPGRRRAASHL